MRRNKAPEEPPEYIGAREAERILGITRTPMHTLATSGRLPGRLIDKRGAPRHWLFKRSDVLRMKAEGTALRQVHPRRPERIAWEQHYGQIPAGYTVAWRDRDENNTSADNLCLVPLRARRKRDSRAGTRHRQRTPWTHQQTEVLRLKFSSTTNQQLADELGAALSTVTRRARQLGLRKSRDFLAQQAQRANRLPVGTERVKKNNNIIWVKISMEGTYNDQWRPKHHISWEQANGQRVPKGYCVAFKDKNIRNFDPENLYLATKKEVATIGFAEYLRYPTPLRNAIRLNNQLKRAVEHHCAGGGDAPVKPKSGRSRSRKQRWTAEMDEVLRREYPTGSLANLLSALGVSMQSLRNRARRLGLHRSPEAMISAARAIAELQKSKALNAGKVYASR